MINENRGYNSDQVFDGIPDIDHKDYHLYGDHRPGLRVELPVSCRVKGVLEMLNQGPAAAFRPGDRHDVESRCVFQQTVSLHEGDGQTRQLPLLDRVNGLGRMADILGCTGLDLDICFIYTLTVKSWYRRNQAITPKGGVMK